jgi:hypothetical protein
MDRVVPLVPNPSSEGCRAGDDSTFGKLKRKADDSDMSCDTIRCKKKFLTSRNMYLAYTNRLKTYNWSAIPLEFTFYNRVLILPNVQVSDTWETVFAHLESLYAIPKYWFVISHHGCTAVDLLHDPRIASQPVAEKMSYSSQRLALVNRKTDANLYIWIRVPSHLRSSPSSSSIIKQETIHGQIYHTQMIRFPNCTTATWKDLYAHVAQLFALDPATFLLQPFDFAPVEPDEYHSVFIRLPDDGPQLSMETLCESRVEPGSAFHLIMHKEIQVNVVCEGLCFPLQISNLLRLNGLVTRIKQELGNETITVCGTPRQISLLPDTAFEIGVRDAETSERLVLIRDSMDGVPYELVHLVYKALFECNPFMVLRHFHGKNEFLCDHEITDGSTIFVNLAVSYPITFYLAPLGSMVSVPKPLSRSQPPSPVSTKRQDMAWLATTLPSKVTKMTLMVEKHFYGNIYHFKILWREKKIRVLGDCTVMQMNREPVPENEYLAQCWNLTWPLQLWLCTDDQNDYDAFKAAAGRDT